MKNKLLSIILIIVTVGLLIASYIMLPDTVMVQISLGGGDGTTMPKLFAILLPAALGIGGAIPIFTASKEEGLNTKALILSAVGILVMGITLAMNL